MASVNLILKEKGGWISNSLQVSKVMLLQKSDDRGNIDNYRKKWFDGISGPSVLLDTKLDFNSEIKHNISEAMQMIGYLKWQYGGKFDQRAFILLYVSFI